MHLACFERAAYLLWAPLILTPTPSTGSHPEPSQDVLLAPPPLLVTPDNSWNMDVVKIWELSRGQCPPAYAPQPPWLLPPQPLFAFSPSLLEAFSVPFLFSSPPSFTEVLVRDSRLAFPFLGWWGSLRGWFRPSAVCGRLWRIPATKPLLANYGSIRECIIHEVTSWHILQILHIFMTRVICFFSLPVRFSF